MKISIIKERRRTAAIVIKDQEEVVVKVPYYMQISQINDLIDAHQKWIEETLQKKQQHILLNDWFVTKKQLYLGEYWPVKIKTIYGAKPMLIFNRELGFVLTTDGSEACARAEMEKFFKSKAKEVLEPIASQYAELIGVNYQKITIRKQATRWGSCSSKDNLSFNMKIMCAPLEKIKYVVLHEVVHLKYFNHSSEFWQEIERWMPNYKECMNYFNQFGQNFIV